MVLKINIKWALDEKKKSAFLILPDCCGPAGLITY